MTRQQTGNRCQDILTVHSGRIALFFATLSPASIWFFAGSKISNPWEVAAWTITSGVLLALVPHRRWARVLAWIQLLALPLIIVWIGTAAATGMAPSVPFIFSAASADFGELTAAVKVAFNQPAFIFASLLTIVCSIWAFKATRSIPHKSGNREAVIFLAALLPLGVSNVDTVPFFSSLVGVETRNTVPFLSFCSLAKESISIADRLYNRAPLNWVGGKHVSAATRQFTVRNGLSVFVIGESLRADSLIRSGRGPWSDKLSQRFEAGLGVRIADACAYGDATYISVPRLLTAVDVTDSYGAEQNPTILAMAKAGGAKTAIIYNHTFFLASEIGHDFVAKLAKLGAPVYDDDTVDALRFFCKRSGSGPKAVVIQLYGQHLIYSDRYPPSAFGPEPEGLTQAALDDLQYDRAAEYGVKILLDLAQVLDEQTEPSFLVFTSDHAENLPRDGTGKRLHALPLVGKNVTTVPVVILWNRAFANSARINALDELLKARGIIAHKDVPNAWLELVGWKDKSTVTASPVTYGMTKDYGQYSAFKCSELPP